MDELTFVNIVGHIHPDLTTFVIPPMQTKQNKQKLMDLNASLCKLVWSGFVTSDDLYPKSWNAISRKKNKKKGKVVLIYEGVIINLESEKLKISIQSHCYATRFPYFSEMTNKV